MIRVLQCSVLHENCGAAHTVVIGQNNGVVENVGTYLREKRRSQ